MPVFNRYELTQRTILALRKTSQEIPFCITVVDNGSETALQKKLIAFTEDGIIDNLFILPRNMGVACAANVGWQMVDAPIYMKLDNDTRITEPHWLKKLLALWRHGQPISTLGGAYDKTMLLQHPGSLSTPDGILGICKTNLPGQAILIPQEVADLLGRWNEDYGLYGAEDGDYGARMEAAGLPQYYYHGPDFFEDLGKNDYQETYVKFHVDKSKETREARVSSKGRLGLFVTNATLYSDCIRNLNVMPRYEIKDISKKYYISIVEREEYKDFRYLLESISVSLTKLVAEKKEISRFEPEFAQNLKRKLAQFGQSIDDMPSNINPSRI